jgi:hypothetical protein
MPAADHEPDGQGRPDRNGRDPPEVADTRMTAQLLQHRQPVSEAPSPRHLVAAALIGAIGAVSFSVAVGSYVVGSTHRFQPATAAEAGSLVAGVPVFVIGGLLHLVLAAALLVGGRRVRTLAVALSGLAAIVAVASAAMLLTGIDPFAGPRAGHPTTQGVAVLLLATAAYGMAALLAGPGAADSRDS